MGEVGPSETGRGRSARMKEEGGVGKQRGSKDRDRMESGDDLGRVVANDDGKEPGIPQKHRDN